MVDTVPGNTSSGAALVLGTATTGSIETASDQDWYRINLTAGKTYTITVDGTGDFPLIDSFLTLRNGVGASIATDDDGASYSNSQITFTATATDTYFVDVGGFDSSDYSLGDFSVLVVDAAVAVSGDSVTAYSGTTAALAIGSTITGKIDTISDHDWYAVSLTAGTTYYFQTAATGGFSDVDTTIFLRDANGKELVENDQGQDDYSFFRFTPSTTGTYYLDVEAYANNDTGAYKLMSGIETSYSYDQIANFLAYDYWGGAQYSGHFDVQPGGTLTVNLTAISSSGQSLARNALALWSDVTGIGFLEVSSGGQIVFRQDEDGAFTSSKSSGGFFSESTVNISNDWLIDFGTTLNSYSFQSYLHEIGHALGLGHAGFYNGDADYSTNATYLNDSWAVSVMSYFDQVENTDISTQGFTREFIVSPMEADILAMRILYGDGASTTRTGDTVYGFDTNSGRPIFDASLNPNVSYTIIDDGGTDTLNYSSFNADQLINLNSETFSNVGSRVGNVMIARDTVIENAAVGAGNDTIIGNDMANKLTGNNGNDTITGGAGNDILDGGLDFDTAVFSGNRSDYLITQEGKNFRVIDQRAGINDGNDLAIGIEAFHFADGKVLTSDLLPAGATKVGSEFRVNTQTADNQYNPTSTGLSNGNFVVSWETGDLTQDGNSSAVKAQLFNVAGVKIGGEFLVNSQAAGGQGLQTIAGLSSGGFVISWTSSDSAQDGSGSAIKAQLFDAGGTKVGGEFLVNSQAAGDQMGIVAGLSNGGFVVSWNTTDPTQDGNKQAIKAQIFNAGGAKVGNEFLVNTQAEGNQFSPTVTGLSNGGFVVSWETNDSNQDGSADAIKAQLFDAFGAKVGSEFLVNTQGSNFQYFPTIKALSNGSFVISWATADGFQDGDGMAVKAQLFSASGAKLGSEFLVNTLTFQYQSSQVVTALSNGGFAVGWVTNDPAQDGSGQALKAQIFDANGAKVGSEFRINTMAAGEQFNPTIVGLNNGGFVVSWETRDTTQDGSGSAIKAQIFELPLSFNAGATQTVTTMEDITTAVNAAATGADSSALTWSIVASPAHGTLTGSAGAYIYTPTADYNGPDSVVVKVADGAGHSATQTVNLTVSAVNDAPMVSVASQKVTTAENTAASVKVTATDVDGDALTYTATGAAKGVVSGGSGGLFTYTPNADVHGTDNFIVTVSDGNGGTATQTVTIDIAPHDLGPVAAIAQFRQGTVPSSLGGTFDVFGDTSAQNLTILDDSDIIFRSGFNSGARDSVTVAGMAQNFVISQVLGNVTLTSITDAIALHIPLGTNGMNLTFDNGDSRVLGIDGNAVLLGTQNVSATPTAVTQGPGVYIPPAESNALPVAAIAQFKQGVLPSSLGGKFDIFGDTSAQILTILDNSDITFRSGFNSGARDSVAVTGTAQSFVISQVLGNVTLASATDAITLHIPLGANGMNLTFDNGDSRVLRIDGNAVLLGMDVISATPTVLTAVSDFL